MISHGKGQREEKSSIKETRNFRTKRGAEIKEKSQERGASKSMTYNA
jgi:hypothetical protein